MQAIHTGWMLFIATGNCLDLRHEIPELEARHDFIRVGAGNGQAGVKTALDLGEVVDPVSLRLFSRVCDLNRDQTPHLSNRSQ